MPPIVAANTVQARLDWTFTGGYAGKNVVHFLVPGGQPAITVADANSVMTSIGGQFTTTGFAASTSNNTSLNSVTLRDVRQQGIPDVVSTVAGVPGTSLGTELPRDTAFVVTLRTALATRRGRGRVYLGGCVVANLDGGTGRALQTYANQAQAFVQSFLALTVNGQPWNLGVLSRTDIPMITRTAVQAVSRDLRFDTQRNRDR